MTLNFASKELGRTLAVSEVHELQLEDCRRFHVELVLAIQQMDDAIQEAHRLDRDAGVPCDRDWLHRTRKKRRITASSTRPPSRNAASAPDATAKG